MLLQLLDHLERHLILGVDFRWLAICSVTLWGILLKPDGLAKLVKAW